MPQRFHEIRQTNYPCDYDDLRSISVGVTSPSAPRKRIQLYAHGADNEVVGIRLDPAKARRLAALLLKIADAAEPAAEPAA